MHQRITPGNGNNLLRAS